MKSPFSYVVLRYMHDVFTREFVNIGVVVHCPQSGFLQMRGAKRLRRVLDMFPGLDKAALSKTLRFMESRFETLQSSLQGSQLKLEAMDAAAIAKAILPIDDSSLQWSPPGGGTTDNPTQVFEDLFERMVTRHENKHPVVRRSDEQVWKPFEKELQIRNKSILPSLQKFELAAGSFRHRFDHVLRSRRGLLHILLPLSFDLVDPSDIVDKAAAWNARFDLLEKSETKFKTFLLIGKPLDESHCGAYEEAKTLLEAKSFERGVWPEDQAAAFAEDFTRSIILFN